MAVQPNAAGSQIDNTDWQILHALPDNARLSYTELGRRVSLSAPAVANRIRRLEEAGVIRGYKAEVDLDALGYPIVVFIRLAVAANREARFTQLLRQRPEVVESYIVSGEENYLIKVAVSSVDQLDNLLAALIKYGQPTTSLVICQQIDQPPFARNGVDEPTQSD